MKMKIIIKHQTNRLIAQENVCVLMLQEKVNDLVVVVATGTRRDERCPLLFIHGIHVCASTQQELH